MGKNSDYIDLVRQARLGHRESMNLLAKSVRERLYDHVYRITLRSHLAQDVVQESLLEMLRVLNNLQSQDEFWPWLCGIAHNKIRHHQRWQRRHGTARLPDGEYDVHAKDKQEGLAELISEELKQTVLTAMENLSQRHRAVLTMRCYDELEYPEIGKLMGCSRFAAKMLFSRAKKSLGKHLSRRGLGKGSLVLVLTLFGRMTSSSEAAGAEVSVTAASIQTGGAAALVTAITSKAAVTSLVAAGAVAVGSITLTTGTDERGAVFGENGAGTAQVQPSPTAISKGTEECWYYYPDGVSRGVMTRLIRYDSRGQRSYCQWLQNDTSNYYFEKKSNTIYLENHRMWNRDLSVRTLPTDRSQLTEFLAQVQNSNVPTEYVSASGPGLLVVAQRSRIDGSGSWRIIRHHNVLEEDYFRCDWPSGTKILDRRDAMHKLGWTWFRIEGDIAGQSVSGVGQIPLFHNTSKRYKPWLRLEIADRLEIVDSSSGASISNAAGKVLENYPAGSFFKGLARPWMGLHTIDIVRRDAAQRQLWFETRYLPKEEKAEVELTCEQGKLVYTVDMEKDLVDKIIFSTTDGKKGELRFTYLQEIDTSSDEFLEPQMRRSYPGKQQASPGISWLIRLITDY